EAWPDDADVKELFEKEFNRPPGEVAFLAPWVRSFAPDTVERRKWLLEAVRSAEPNSARYALYEMIEEFKDEDCFRAALTLQGTGIWYYDKMHIRSLLIEHFPDDPEVRSWA